MNKNWHIVILAAIASLSLAACGGGKSASTSPTASDSAGGQPLPNSAPVNAGTPVTTLTAGTANLSWSAPSQNNDGSMLTDLAGYRIYHGFSADALYEMTQISGANSTSYSFKQLPSGTHYFAVVAYNDAGYESDLSVVGSKTIL